MISSVVLLVASLTLAASILAWEMRVFVKLNFEA